MIRFTKIRNVVFYNNVFIKKLFFFRTISHFFEFKKADDSTQKIKQLNSEAEKTKANKFSIDELTKTQTKKQEIKTIFFSITDISSFVEENDIDD
jgi:outer membrane scaffolding protein for murein synthesis (MipA/OmpV family)